MILNKVADVNIILESFPITIFYINKKIFYKIYEIFNLTESIENCT